MDYDPDKVAEAVTVLLKSQGIQYPDKKPADEAGAVLRKVPLIPEQPTISITVVQKRFSRLKYRKLKCELPKPFRSVQSELDVCLIIKDISREKTFDQERGVDRYKDLLRRAGVSGITEVITFTQLRTEYKPYEAKRKLVSRYDLFLTDERIYGKLATVLGSKFFTKNKFPVPVDIAGAPDLASEIRSAIEATYLTIQGKGAQTSIQIASGDQPAEDILQNAVAVIDFLKLKFPGGWENVRSLYLKFGKISLPVYLNTDSPNALPVARAPVGNGFTAAPEEVTTVRGAKVKISRAGTVKLVKRRKRNKTAKKTV